MLQPSDTALARRGPWGPLLALVLLLTGCVSWGPREASRIEPVRQQIVLEALGQIGRPYRFGGATPAGFDCSGLVHYVYAQAGQRLPRTVAEQWQQGRAIRPDAALPGDLLFYRFGPQGVDHVAVYLGDGRAVHAPATGRTVIVAGVGEPYWQARLVGARRWIDGP